MHSLIFFMVFIVLSVFFPISSSADKDNQPLKREKRFLSFNSKDGDIDVDLELSVPFISIPLAHGDASDDGEPKPLANVNLKAIAIAGILVTIATFVVPLLIKPPMEHRYRRLEEMEFQETGQALNELLFGNNYVTPCLQQFICNAVAKTRKRKDPTSSEKIIDGITNLGWFKNMVNGTSIQEAIKVGRLQHAPCSISFKGCKMPEDVVQALINELGFL